MSSGLPLPDTSTLNGRITLGDRQEPDNLDAWKMHPHSLINTVTVAEGIADFASWFPRL